MAAPTRLAFANSSAHTLLGSVGGPHGSGVSPFGSQLVLGIVTNNSDPDGLGRVRVKYPALGDDVEGNWARIASVSAGNARGVMMLPVVGEEVLSASNTRIRPVLMYSVRCSTASTRRATI